MLTTNESGVRAERVVPRARQLFLPARRGFDNPSKEPRRFLSHRRQQAVLVDRPKPSNPNIALLQRRGALRTLRAFDVADAERLSAKTETHPRIEAQSADELRQTIVRRVRT